MGDVLVPTSWADVICMLFLDQPRGEPGGRDEENVSWRLGRLVVGVMKYTPDLV